MCNLVRENMRSILRLNTSRDEAAKSIKKTQKTQKRHHDKGIKSTDIKIGDRVLLHNTRKTIPERQQERGENSLRIWLDTMLLKMFLRRELIEWKELKCRKLQSTNTVCDQKWIIHPNYKGSWKEEKICLRRRCHSRKKKWRSDIDVEENNDFNF